MPEEDSNIFPIVDRRAPVLERLRGGEEDDELASDLGETVGKAVKSDDEEKLDEAHQKFVEGFTEALAGELGVSEDDIDIGYVERVADYVTSVSEPDVLSDDALESLGIPTESDEEDSDAMDF